MVFARHILNRGILTTTKGFYVTIRSKMSPYATMNKETRVLLFEAYLLKFDFLKKKIKLKKMANLTEKLAELKWEL